jgi:hypothetical protein
MLVEEMNDWVRITYGEEYDWGYLRPRYVGDSWAVSLTAQESAHDLLPEFRLLDNTWGWVRNYVGVAIFERVQPVATAAATGAPTLSLSLSCKFCVGLCS